MFEENKEKMVQAIANSVLNSLNINGIVEACKIYSINIAGKQYEEMSDENKQKLLDNMEKIDAEQSAPQVEEVEEVEEAEVEVV
jgi:hypothetical protein